MVMWLILEHRSAFAVSSKDLPHSFECRRTATVLHLPPQTRDSSEQNLQRQLYRSGAAGLEERIESASVTATTKTTRDSRNRPAKVCWGYERATGVVEPALRVGEVGVIEDIERLGAEFHLKRAHLEAATQSQIHLPRAKPIQRVPLHCPFPTCTRRYRKGCGV